MIAAVMVAGTAVIGCSSDTTDAPVTPAKTDAEYATDVTSGLKSNVTVELTALHDAAVELAAAAPTTTGRGWDATLDAAAITAMKTAWRKCRVAYEHVEGATAPIYPDADSFIDGRYDDFLSAIGPQGDQDLFDDQGVIGMHAIERILYAPEIPSFVITFEESLPGYKAAAFPATEAESTEFRTKLLPKLVTDTNTLLDEWQAGAVDLSSAYSGLVSLMHEQTEKVNNASTGEEESRYSQLTLADLHANLEGAQSAYALFQPWILSKTNSTDPTKDGPSIDAKIQAGFKVLQDAYNAQPGDAIPQPPATWSAENPSAADLLSPFGKLYATTRQEADVMTPDSVVFEMNLTASLLGFTPFSE